MSAGRIRKRENPFSQISNVLIRDKNISLKAKGLYALIESYLNIPDFTLYKDMLCSCCLEGSGAFDSAWNELKKAGYLVQYKTKGEKGTFVYEYELLEVPESTPQKSTPGKSTCGHSTSGSTTPGESTSLNISREEINTQEYYLNNNINNKENAVDKKRKMSFQDISDYFDKFSAWFNDYSKFEPEKLSSVKEKLTQLLKNIPADTAEILRGFNDIQALDFFGKAMEVYYPSQETEQFSNPVFNKEGYLVGILRNF